jgi:hypothetical protein
LNYSAAECYSTKITIPLILIFLQGLQTAPLLESTQEVQQKLKDGVLNSAESHETYLYRPFSNQEAGAKTIVDSKLTLVVSKKQAAPASELQKLHSLYVPI